MSKNKKYNKTDKNVKVNTTEISYNKISKLGKKIIFYSIISLIFGFILLKFTNPDGSNLASIISPFVIILSYVGIAIGIIYPEKNKEI